MGNYNICHMLFERTLDWERGKIGFKTWLCISIENTFHLSEPWFLIWHMRIWNELFLRSCLSLTFCDL